jgi:ankyrin repeat protein
VGKVVFSRDALLTPARFRWVACQLDYLAGLPNYLRRQALKRLPPTLNETYDRILEQILDQSVDTSISDIIQKALHWICYVENDLEISQLCEAVSIQDGKDSLDSGDLIVESDIARYCSSLIRKSYDGRCFELAHFTVKEYLLKIDPTSKLKIFRYDPDNASESLTTISLRFLMFPKFRRQPVPDASELDRMSKRGEMHPFYSYATTFWPEQYQVHDKREIQQLIKDLFGTRKKLFFQNWLIAYLYDLEDSNCPAESFSKTILFVIRQDLSPLHVAASLSLLGICRWLLEVGESPNAKSRVGTPLHCALAGPLIFHTHDIDLIRHLRNLEVNALHLGNTIQLLLEYGADVNSTWAGISFPTWALDVCVSMKCANPFIPLLHKLTIFKTDTIEKIRDLYREIYNQEFVHDIFQAVLNMEPNSTGNPSLSRLVSTVKTKIRVRGDWDEYEHTSEEFSIATVPDEDFHQLVESAARRDDANEMTALLADPRFEDLGLRSEISAQSPLHYAVLEASCDTIKVLLESKFDFNFADIKGDFPLHLCLHHFQVEALRMLLKNVLSSEEVDAGGNTLWHLAAAQDSTEILKTLLQANGDVTRALKKCSNIGRTPLAHALSNSRGRAACLLLENCSTDPEFFCSDIPVTHLAAAIGLESLFKSLLAKHKSVADLALDGSTPLHYINLTIEPELFQSLIKIYEVEHRRRDGKTAFEVLFDNIIDRKNRVFIPTLYRERLTPLQLLIESLLPPSHTVGTMNRSQHVWEFFCRDILETWNGIRYPLLAPHVLPSLIKKGVLSSYEELKDQSAFTPLCRSLTEISPSILNQGWVVVLIETVLIELQQSRFKDPIKSPVVVVLFKKAIENSAIPLVKFLIGKDVSVHSSESNVSAIEHACEYGSLGTFQLIFSCHDPSLLNNTGDSGMGLIHRLVIQNAPFASQKLKHTLECGLDPNIKTTTYWKAPAIVMAADFGKWEAVDLLLDHGADLYAIDGNGLDVGKCAAWGGEEKYIRQVQAGAERVKYDWNSSATMCIKKKKRGTIRLKGCHLLHFAAYNGRTELLRYLLEEGIIDNDLDRRSVDQLTPLHLASIGGHVETVQFLVESGADVNALECNTKRAIDLAFEENALDLVRTLLRLGSVKPSNEKLADLCLLEIASDDRGLAQRDTLLGTSTANQLRYFESAIVSGDLELCQRMVARGCSVKAPLPTCHGCNALTRAVRADELDIVKWLLNQGARPEEIRCPREHPAEWGTIHAAVKSPKLSESCLVQLLGSALQNEYDWTNNRNQINPIHIATLWGNVAALNILVGHLKRNADRYESVI